MKNKIAIKLTAYFFVALLLFSFTIGGVFIALFRNYTIEKSRADLERRAVSIAETLSAFMDNSSPEIRRGMGNSAMGGRKAGYGHYLNMLNDIAMADLWLVDINMELITGSHMGSQFRYSDLPPDADQVVKEVFDGYTTFSEGFSVLINTPTLTVGTPVKSGGQIIGALLMHSPVEGINEATAQGISIMGISVLCALLIAVILSVVLALSFTKPLGKMKQTAMHLASGDYTVKTGVSQKDEIGDLAAAIDTLSERLSDAQLETLKLDRLRRDFVSNVSHELRTPVTVIRGSLEALCDEVVTEPEQVKIYHRQMLNESIYLQRLVNDLLELSRLQNTDFHMEMQELNLNDVVADAVRSAEQLAVQKHIDIITKMDTQVFSMFGDYGRLRQMLLIVLDNAVKFSPLNGTVTVSAMNGVISIRDNGSGIPEEDLPHIFDRFYKVRPEENKSGSGLGLAIAKQIADRHNIRAAVESSLGEGTVFTFYFKL